MYTVLILASSSSCKTRSHFLKSWVSLRLSCLEEYNDFFYKHLVDDENATVAEVNLLSIKIYKIQQCKNSASWKDI